MVICTVEVNEKAPQTIVIGRRGTYNTQEVVFDIGYLIDAYGVGTAVLAVKRSQDSSAYPAVVAQEDSTVTWTVSETDTYYKGAGECELMWYVDGGLAKTIIYPMVVMRDILSTTEEAPDAYENWVESLTALGAETLENAQNAAQSASDAENAKDDAVTAKEAAETAAEKAEEASVHSPVIQDGYWYIWNNGEYVSTGVRAEGQKGDKGDTGEKGDAGNGIVSITKTGTSGLVDTYTVTYTDGATTTFTVTNGAKGDKGDTGATGNGIASIAKTGTSGNVDTYTITYTNGQTTTFTVTNGAVSSVAGKTGAVTLNANDIAFSESGTYDEGTVGAEVSAQKNAISQLGDIAAFKTAILQLAQKVAYIDDDGADYYQDLYDALYSGSLLGIDAVYTQSGVVFTTDTLDYLKSDLVVTAHYSTGDVVVTDYTMSGTLAVGTSTVTVSYGGMTDTFSVTVKRSTQPVIEYENSYLYKGDGAGVPQPTAKEYAGVTTKYPITATTTLYPAGVIVQDGLFGTNRGTLAIYNGDTYVNYVDEVNRWAKAPAESYTEFNSKSWTVNQYDGIIFSIDMRYIDDSYMYDYTTGTIWFAGRNTRYAGMQNVSEAV